MTAVARHSGTLDDAANAAGPHPVIRLQQTASRSMLASGTTLVLGGVIPEYHIKDSKTNSVPGREDLLILITPTVTPGK